MLDLMGKSIGQDWKMTHERLTSAARDRQGASFDEIVVYESPPTPVGMVFRAFTGVMAWQSSADTVSQTAFVAIPATVGFADLMSEGDFEQLRKMACRDYPGIAYHPAST